MAKEAVEALKQVSYDLGLQETEVCLADELAEVCKDYFQEVWIEALNLARVPVASQQRKAENIFYPLDIREVPTALLSFIILALTSSEQPFTTQDLLPLVEVPKGPGKASDQGQEVEVAKGKGADQGGSRLKDKGKSSYQRLRAQRIPLRSRIRLSRLRRLIPNPRRLIPRPLTFLSPNRATRLTLPPPPPAKAQFRIIFFCLWLCVCIYIYLYVISFVMAFCHVQDALLPLLNENTLSFALGLLFFQQCLSSVGCSCHFTFC